MNYWHPLWHRDVFKEIPPKSLDIQSNPKQCQGCSAHIHPLTLAKTLACAMGPAESLGQVQEASCWAFKHGSGNSIWIACYCHPFHSSWAWYTPNTPLQTIPPPPPTWRNKPCAAQWDLTSAIRHANMILHWQDSPGVSTGTLTPMVPQSALWCFCKTLGRHSTQNWQSLHRC